MALVDKTLGYNPLLKEVLKNFQETAVRSLSGPLEFPVPCVQPDGQLRPAESRKGKRAEWRLEGNDDGKIGRSFTGGSELRVRSKCSAQAKSGRTTPYAGVRGQSFYLSLESSVPRFLQTPLLLPQDSSVSETTETVLEGEKIACFDIGGEKRLCVPEVLRKVLNSFDLGEINRVYDELHIFTSLCSHAQLCALKRQGTLPLSAATCGLITRTYAERLCSTLLHHLGDMMSRTVSGETIHVQHRCFGKSTGVFFLNMYTSTLARCVECCECSGLFSPSEFVCHTHHGLENRTCHWGFDSSRWRNYLMLAKEEKQNSRAKRLLEEVKAIFDNRRTLSLDQFAEAAEEKAAFQTTTGRSDIAEWTENSKQKSCHLSLACFSTGPDLSYADHPPFHTTNRDERHFASGESLGAQGTCDEFRQQWNQMSNWENLNKDDFDQVCKVSSRSGSFAADVYSVNTEPCDGNGACSIMEQIKDLNKECSTLSLEQSRLWQMELDIFSCALKQASSLSSDAKQQVINEYVGLQQQHLSVAKRLIGIQKTLKEELSGLHGRMNKRLVVAEAESRAKEQELLITSCTNKAKLKEAEQENAKLKEEVEAIASGNKRSDIGLLKAKYKAQVEHFRRKLQSVEHSNKMLIRKHAELHQRLRQHLSIVPHNDTNTAFAPLEVAHRARCHSTSGSFAPL